MIVYPKTEQENNALKLWITERVKDYRSGPYTMCVGVERSEKLVAVVAWDNYRGRDIEVTFAADSPRWATRQTVATLLSYPFLQLGCQRITSFVYKSNKRARKLNLGLGFKQEGCHRHAGRNLEPVLSYGMTRMDFDKRYLKHGLQESTHTAAAA